jgi:hypothetical protein
MPMRHCRAKRRRRRAARRGYRHGAPVAGCSGADPNAREVNGGQNALMWTIAERHSRLRGAGAAWR